MLQFYNVNQQRRRGNSAGKTWEDYNVVWLFGREGANMCMYIYIIYLYIHTCIHFFPLPSPQIAMYSARRYGPAVH